MFYVYVLISLKDGRLYKGLTSNIDSRVKQHNAGKTKSTKAFRPWKLVYFEEFQDKNRARNREKFLKSGKGREFLKHIISR